MREIDNHLPQTPLVELLIDDRVPAHAVEKYISMLDYLSRLHGGEGIICGVKAVDVEPE